MVSPEPDGAGHVRLVDAVTCETISDHTSSDLAGWMAGYEAEHHPRWVLPGRAPVTCS